MTPAPFDIAAAIKRLAAIYWTQFAAITLLGMVLMTLPSVFVRAAFGAMPEGDAGTWIETLLALLAMVFVAAINAGVLITGGEGQHPRAFVRGGLAAARPGVVVALLLGAVIMLAVILRLTLRLLVGAPGFPGFLLFVALAAFLVTAFAAIPAAIVERLLPVAAIRRSWTLTAGNRWRITGFVAVIAIGLLPAAMLANLVVFGANATPESAETVTKAMTLASPGFWIGELFDLLVFGFLAPAPAVAYLQLTGRR